MEPPRSLFGPKVFPALVLCSVWILTLAGCSASANSEDRASDNARQIQRYLGTWQQIAGAGNIKIKEDGTGILVQDDNGHTLVGSIDSAGDLETGFGKMSIDPKTSHLVSVTGEYERVSD